MGEEKSNYIQQKFKLGTRPYTDLRQFLLPHVELSSAKQIRSFRKKNQPTPEICHDNGLWVPLNDLFRFVTKNYLENLVELNGEKLRQIEMGMTVRATCGFDGNGGNTVYKSCSKQEASIIFGGIRIFEINSQDYNQDEPIYVEHSSGPQTETPWFLIPSRKFLFFSLPIISFFFFIIILSYFSINDFTIN